MKQSNKKTNILIYSDYDCSTGFGNVAAELIKRIKSHYRNCSITILAINNFSDKQYVVLEDVTVIPVHLLQPEERKQDAYCRVGLLRYMTLNVFDLFFVINDIELAYSFAPYLKDVRKHKKENNIKSFKSILYFPVDSIPNKKHVSELSFFDELITFTEYGKNAISEMLSPADRKKLKVINHGVDTTVFFKKEENEMLEIKKYLYYEDRFIIGSINRNSPRKDVVTLLIAFRKLKNIVHPDKSDKPLLYLHMNPLDPCGTNLLDVCEALNLEINKDVFFTPDFNENQGVDTESVNILYNMFDVFVTTTTAEGWGLTVTEAMACETLVMAPMHTSLTEISDNGKRCIPIRDLKDYIFKDDGYKIRKVSDPDKVAFQLHTLFVLHEESPDLFDIQKTTYTAAATEYVSGLSWDRVFLKFKLIFNKYLK